MSKKKDTFPPTNNKNLTLTLSPLEYDFIICGFKAIVKLFVKFITHLFTCCAIALAAFTVGPKKCSSVYLALDLLTKKQKNQIYSKKRNQASVLTLVYQDVSKQHIP